jgi:hypothetical protein
VFNNWLLCFRNNFYVGKEDLIELRPAVIKWENWQHAQTATFNAIGPPYPWVSHQQSQSTIEHNICKSGVVSHTCNLSYSRGKVRRLRVHGQPEKEVSETLSQQISQAHD